jgi:hypothetical protein
MSKTMLSLKYHSSLSNICKKYGLKNKTFVFYQNNCSHFLRFCQTFHYTEVLSDSEFISVSVYVKVF